MANILVVDDNRDAGKLLVRILTRWGHDAIYQASGESALDYLQQHPVALVILDVMMPGMDGMEVLRQVRSTACTSHLPVILYSAVSDPAFVKHALEKGATDYWVKASFDMSKLQAGIDRWLPPPSL